MWKCRAAIDRITNGNEEHDRLGVGGELPLIYETSHKTRHLLPTHVIRYKLPKVPIIASGCIVVLPSCFILDLDHLEHQSTQAASSTQDKSSTPAAPTQSAIHTPLALCCPGLCLPGPTQLLTLTPSASGLAEPRVLSYIRAQGMPMTAACRASESIAESIENSSIFHFQRGIAHLQAQPHNATGVESCRMGTYQSDAIIPDTEYRFCPQDQVDRCYH